MGLLVGAETAGRVHVLGVQSNLASTYQLVGRPDEALRSRQDAYSGYLKLIGEEHAITLLAANNYADSLNDLGRFKEVKSLRRKAIPVARRVLGEGHDVTFRMRKGYARALYEDPAATLDDLREAVNTLEDTARIARRVMGSAHPLTATIEEDLRRSRAALRAREMSPGSA